MHLSTTTLASLLVSLALAESENDLGYLHCVTAVVEDLDFPHCSSPYKLDCFCASPYRDIHQLSPAAQETCSRNGVARSQIPEYLCNDDNVPISPRKGSEPMVRLGSNPNDNANNYKKVEDPSSSASATPSTIPDPHRTHFTPRAIRPETEVVQEDEVNEIPGTRLLIPQTTNLADEKNTNTDNDADGESEVVYHVVTVTHTACACTESETGTGAGGGEATPAPAPAPLATGIETETETDVFSGVPGAEVTGDQTQSQLEETAKQQEQQDEEEAQEQEVDDDEQTGSAFTSTVSIPNPSSSVRTSTRISDTARPTGQDATRPSGGPSSSPSSSSDDGGDDEDQQQMFEGKASGMNALNMKSRAGLGIVGLMGYLLFAV